MSCKHLIFQRELKGLINITLRTVLVLAFSFSSVAAATLNWEGAARDFRGNLLYVEKHQTKTENGKLQSSLTRYFSSDRLRLLAVLDSTYAGLPQHAQYSFQEKESSYQDGARIAGNEVELFRQKGEAANEETKTIDLSTELVLGQGFHYLVQSQLSKLIRGARLQIRLAFPSRLNTYSFVIRLREIDQEAGEAKIWLEMDNWFLRMFVDRIEVVYDIQTGRLLRYYGASNLSQFRGQKIRIEYTYLD